MVLPHLISTAPDIPPGPAEDHLLPPSTDKSETFPAVDCKDSTEERPESEKKELWSFRDTSLLLDLYEQIFVTLGRGMIRKNDWNKISEQLTQQSRFARSAEQCKNRIEYLRKHYRKEKARFIGSNIVSQWTFYKKLEALVEDHSRQPEICSKPLLATNIAGGVEINDHGRLDGKPSESSKPLSATNIAGAVEFNSHGRLDGKPSESLKHFSATNIAGAVEFNDHGRLDGKPSENSKLLSAMNGGNGIDFNACSDGRHVNPDPSSPADPNSHPVDALDEEETVAAATKAQAAATPETSYKPPRKRRKVGVSLGKDLKEGLSEFAAVMERIERTKMEMVLMLEKQRVEQEQKRADLEMERTKMLLQNQLEVAKLFCRNRSGGSEGEK